MLWLCAYILANTGKALSAPQEENRYRGLSGNHSNADAATKPGAHHDQMNTLQGTILKPKSGNDQLPGMISQARPENES